MTVWQAPFRAMEEPILSLRLDCGALIRKIFPLAIGSTFLTIPISVMIPVNI